MYLPKCFMMPGLLRARHPPAAAYKKDTNGDFVIVPEEVENVRTLFVVSSLGAKNGADQPFRIDERPFLVFILLGVNPASDPEKRNPEIIRG